jgi:hypothetical protein
MRWLAVLAVAMALAQTPTPVEFKCTQQDFDASGCEPDEPCPMYLELSSLEALGARLFLAGNIHTARMTLSSVLLTTDDGAMTWREPWPRSRATVLDQIQFFDFVSGWVSGQTVDTLPRDPFLLITKDGGKTWERTPLFAEGTIGAIERFHFDSRTHGMLWADRTKSGEARMGYQSYETMNGGETWTLREVSEHPIKYRLPVMPESAWRLRADRATRSYHVEKLQGEDWHSVAAFPIQIGECKP